MSTPAQVAANQANAQLSTGPKSEAGRAASSQNAATHLLTSKTRVALPGEEEAFAAHLKSYLDRYRPVDAPERDCVRVLAEENWRLDRAHAMEKALYEQALFENPDEPAALVCAQAFLDPKRGIKTIALYATRIQRDIKKTQAQLDALQSSRKSAYAQAEEEAILLVRRAAAKGETIDLAKDFPPPEEAGGFDFSTAKIAQKMSRLMRLEEARMMFQPPVI